MRSLIYLFIFLIALVAGVVFGFYNTSTVTVNLVFREVQMPLVASLACAFALGMVLSLLVLVIRMIVLKSRLGRTRSQLASARSTIQNLRSQPIHDG